MTTRTLSMTSTTSNRRWDALQFRFVFGLCLMTFLVSTTISRLGRLYRSSAQGATRGRSILSEAWEASGTVAKFAFAG